MRIILSVAMILFATTKFLFCMEEGEAKRIFIKAFRKGPLNLFLSQSVDSKEFEVSVLRNKGTEYEMYVSPFKMVAALIRKTYQDMEVDGIAAAINPSDQKTQKELIKFYNFMKDKDLPKQVPSIHEIAREMDKIKEKEDNVEKFIGKTSSLLNKKRSIVEYVNAASKDHDGDKNKAWQAAIEQIKIARASYRNVYLNNKPESCQTDWILHPKGLYYKK